MDAEALKPLLSLLLWGGLFFFMMRFGCGAHMVGGHGHHEHGKPDETPAPVKDPVCGMDVDSAKRALRASAGQLASRPKR